METIVCLVGASGVGKTTVARVLEKGLGYNVIKSYTTRPKRTEDEYGHTFVDSGALDALMSSDLKDEIIAHSRFKDYDYWAVRAQYKNREHSIYVVDPRGVEMLAAVQSKFNFNIIVIYLLLDIKDRHSRLIEEMRLGNTQFDYAYANTIVNERLTRETKQFEVVKCDYALYNLKSDVTASIVHNILTTKNENKVK